MLISYLIDKNFDISPRPEDRELHVIRMDKPLNSVYFPKDSTHKQGLRLPEELLTEEIKETQAYRDYD